ncbi:cupredoxin domain-containing protein [Streptomyces sp. NPDC057682]|uniref:cupredoxin domain-containing protein n=1 Tax=unclassified Streptomyces TaxID=2593676 RepID=UPI0036524C96
MRWSPFPLRVRLAVAVVVGCATVLAGCSGGGGGASPSATSSATPSADGGAMITIEDFAFRPAASSVAPGSRVTVINKDATVHTVTATDGTSFDTGEVKPGQKVTFTAPSRPGAYPYICTIHPTMRGTLTVR